MMNPSNKRILLLIIGLLACTGFYIAVIAGLCFSRWCDSSHPISRTGIALCFLGLFTPVYWFYQTFFFISPSTSLFLYFLLSLAFALIGAMIAYYLRKKAKQTWVAAIMVSAICALFFTFTILAGGHGAGIVPFIVSLPFLANTSSELLFLPLASFAKAFFAFIILWMPIKSLSKVNDTVATNSTIT